MDPMGIVDGTNQQITCCWYAELVVHVRWLAGFMKINSRNKIYPLLQFQELHSKSQDVVKLCNYYRQSNTTRTNIPVYNTYIAIQLYDMYYYNYDHK